MNARPTLLVLAALAVSLASAAQEAPRSGSSAQAPSRVPGTAERSPASDFLERAEKAEARGDLEAAERHYQGAIDVRPNSLSLHTRLARFYDRGGRDREAYREYRVLIVGRPNAWYSDQYDPIVLARYGDLSARFGSPDEARRAYTVAASQSNRDDYWNPRTTPRSASFASLKAAAHTAAAIQLSGTRGDEEALKELRIAVATDPFYWVPHFYLAQYLDGKAGGEAGREAAISLRLAPSEKYRAMVKRMRANLRHAD